ncbi:MAG: ATP-binding protein, partial [bacterium]
NLLGAARAFLVAVLVERGYAQDLVDDVEMATDEAMTNAIEHAYEFDARCTVFVEMDLDKGRACVKVKDQGKAFDPLAVGPINLDRHVEERRTGGLGVHLMRTIMDSVEYRREDGFNVLTLIKQAVA